MPVLSREHEETRQLLPWYLNGTLEGEELQRVRQHLGMCLVCRQELTGMRRQAECIEAHDQPLAQPDQSFARLMHRIKADKDRHPFQKLISGWITNAKNRPSRWIVRRPVWAGALLLLVTISITTSGVVLYRGLPEPVTYRTLADTPPASVTSPATERTLRAVFDGSLNLGDFQKLLRECAVTISAGPNSAGAYTLQATAGSSDGRQNALICLRAKSVVLFAEPVMGINSVD